MIVNCELHNNARWKKDKLTNKKQSFNVSARVKLTNKRHGVRRGWHRFSDEKQKNSQRQHHRHT